MGDGERCVLLHGQLDETVGPLTIEMAEAWIDRFDNGTPPEVPAGQPQTSSAVPLPKSKHSNGERAR
jgi:hypothetical protein